MEGSKMTGKEILLNALVCKPTPRVPWVPFVGVHGGELIGEDATVYLQSADHIVSAIQEAKRRYRPDGIPVVFDLQLEAEILGCGLAWARETPPSVATHPLGEGNDTSILPEFSVKKGRMPIVLDAVSRLKTKIGEEVALYGLLTGPLTLALHLRGDEILLDMFDGEESVPLLLDYCADVACKMADAYIEAGIDVVAVVDPMISQIGPDHFNEYVAPALNRIFDHIRTKGALSSLFVCGNATRNLQVMAATTCDNISVDENVDMAALARIARAAGKSFGGNMQLTVVLLLGDENDARRDAVRCMDQAGEGAGFVLAPGCDLPYAVKPENLEAVAALVHDPYMVEVARKLPAKDVNDPFDDVVVPDYSKEEAVIIDVVTLDSAGCAPCAYMLKAAQEAASAFNGPAKVREHKITGRDGLGYMKKLSVTAIPSICIDGKEHFASIIPDRKELVAALEAASEK
jgi:MtaA/CmuA family methyltransferase